MSPCSLLLLLLLLLESMSFIHFDIFSDALVSGCVGSISQRRAEA